MRRMLAGTIVVTGCVGLTLLAKEIGPAGGPTIQNGAPVNPAEVREHIERLGSPNFRDREAAGKALVAAGDRVLPQLKDAIKTVEDPEANRRLQMIVETMEMNRLILPRKITLKAENKSAKAIVEEIEKQSGYTLTYGGGNDEGRKFSYDWKEMPFWQALDRICEDAGMQANPNGNDGGLSLYNNGQSFSPYVCYSGPFKVMATNINMSRNVQLANIPRNGGASNNEYNNLNLTVHSEPKAPIVMIGQAKLTKAVDENNNSLLVPENGNNNVHQTYYGGHSYYRQFYQSFSVNLVRPNKNSEKIKEVSGKVPVTMLSETRPEITVDDVLKVKDKKFVGRTVELNVKSTNYANDTFTMDVTVSRRNAANQEDYNWAYGVTQRFQVTDANGKPYIFNGVQSQQHGNNVTTVTLQFRHPYNKKLGKPAKLEYQEWFTVTRDVEFSFKDLPLP